MTKIIISDPTLRDGNHSVRHQLTLENYISYCKYANDAGIPIVEIGHGNGLGASSILIGESKVDDDTMIVSCREHLKTSKLGIHAIPGFCTIKQHLYKAIDQGVDVFRIASHCTEADITKRHIEFVRNNDKEAVGVLMLSHMAPISELVSEAKKMESYGAQSLIIMDSAGYYFPDDVKHRIDSLVSGLSIPVGFHGHNNLGMAVINSIYAIKAGATIIDGTTRGFGAGAGNTQLEVLIAVLKRMEIDTGVDLYKLLDLSTFVENTFVNGTPHISPLSIVSGLAGVFSGFMKPVEAVAKEYGVDPRDIFLELGNRKAIAGQESIIFEIAKELSSNKL